MLTGTCVTPKLVGRILVKAGIASEQKFLQAGTKKVKQVIVRKTGELGRKLTAHSFRQTFATRLARATGGDQFVLKATPRSVRPTATATSERRLAW